MVDLLLLLMRYGGFLVIILCLIGLGLSVAQYRASRAETRRIVAVDFAASCLTGLVVGALMMSGSFLCAA